MPVKKRAKPTGDEAGLVARIKSDPNDPVPKLVYADWLAERGRHVEAAEQRTAAEPTRLVYRMRHKPTGAVFEHRESGTGFKLAVCPSGRVVSENHTPSLRLDENQMWHLLNSAPDYWQTRLKTAVRPTAWALGMEQRTVPLVEFEVIVERWVPAEVAVEPLSDFVSRPAAAERFVPMPHPAPT